MASFYDYSQREIDRNARILEQAMRGVPMKEPSQANGLAPVTIDQRRKPNDPHKVRIGQGNPVDLNPVMRKSTRRQMANETRQEYPEMPNDLNDDQRSFYHELRRNGASHTYVMRRLQKIMDYNAYRSNNPKIQENNEMDDIPEANRKFRKGDSIRLNMVGAKPETVLAVNHPMVSTYEGGHYHHTKCRLLSNERLSESQMTIFSDGKPSFGYAPHGVVHSKELRPLSEQQLHAVSMVIEAMTGNDPIRNPQRHDLIKGSPSYGQRPEGRLRSVDFNAGSYGKRSMDMVRYDDSNGNGDDVFQATNIAGPGDRITAKARQQPRPFDREEFYDVTLDDDALQILQAHGYYLTDDEE